MNKVFESIRHSSTRLSKIRPPETRSTVDRYLVEGQGFNTEEEQNFGGLISEIWSRSYTLWQCNAA